MTREDLKFAARQLELYVIRLEDERDDMEATKGKVRDLRIARINAVVEKMKKAAS